mmetsp:Transcript_6911/g.21809  ORF Transcript_6911/g.21809 Transcript_6911/m.21809 type:complete len:81 (+) Transcript_6911:2536-2778(+)
MSTKLTEKIEEVPRGLEQQGDLCWRVADFTTDFQPRYGQFHSANVQISSLWLCYSYSCVSMPAFLLWDYRAKKFKPINQK